MQRKSVRLKEFDYSQNGYYFITICTKDRKNILSDIVGDGACDIPKIQLCHYGDIVEKNIKKMNMQYGNVRIKKYVIMPNHIHLLIEISDSQSIDNILCGSSRAPNPTNAIIPKYISLFKRYCNRECGINIFQRSFYDHIIRDENDYIEICRYIMENPCKWQIDKLYTKK